MSTPSEDITLSGVHSEIRRIIRANRKHFYILDLLFLLPLSALINNYTAFYPIPLDSNFTFPAITFVKILHIVITWLFSISASGTMIYSVYHGYYNRPVELIPTIQSLSSSFIPLGATLIVSKLIFFLISFLIGILGGVLYIWLESFTWTIIVVILVILIWVTCLQVNWFISYVIVVVESKWGYEPLRRSAYLMNGKRKTALKIILLFGYLTSICWFDNIYFNPDYSYMWDGFGNRMNQIFKMVMNNCLMTMVMEYYLAAVVVMYIHCKKEHGELALETQPEEYVSLLINEDGNKSVAAAVHT